ncbi:glycosyltransferase [Flavobacteriaceae bacterium R33]|uniref:Glycosyltransferase n=2 Tax=Poritiphilus flavus TaxID=2697053 RepID=A0A6L9E6L7_9FLAO|nr:glycosyltransferase [Poritiphilus flavus]
MPCLNEVETLAICIKKAQAFLKKYSISGEVIIADNGSTDGSVKVAEKLGVKVVHAALKGYGAALREGIDHAEGIYVIMGDSDDSYDFSNLMPFIDKLREGHDLVMGNRFKGGIKKAAMPFLHKYVGNPVLSYIGRLFFKVNIGDFHCGLRAFSRKSYEKMNLKTIGMEFASEMVVKASLLKMSISEVPTTLSPDGRSRPPHLRTFRDGWRHLRFLLMFSPKWLFLVPGLVLLTTSLIGSGLIFIGPLKIGNVGFDIHTLIVLSFVFLVGIQFIFFHVFVKTYRVTSGLLPQGNGLYSFYRIFTLEKGICTGFIVLLLGIVLFVFNFMIWEDTGFSELQPTFFVKKILLSTVPIILGIQIIFYSFILSLISVGSK